MIVSTRQLRQSRLSGFGGDPWIDYCTKTYANDGANLSKCKKWYPFAPWTIAGKLARGLPVSGSSVSSAVEETKKFVESSTQSSTPGAVHYPGTTVDPNKSNLQVSTGEEETIFGMPASVVKWGGILLGVGLGAALLKKKGR